MGACVNRNLKARNQSKKDSLQQPPSDSELFNPQHNPNIRVLRFQGLLSNVRIQGNIDQPLGVSFEIPDQLMKAQFPLTKPDGNQKKVIRWRIREQTFVFTADQYAMRKSCLYIKVHKENSQVLEEVRINLYKVLTGPIKNNFKLRSVSQGYAHLIFDLKVSQVLRPEIRVKSARLFLKNEFPGQKFNFTMQLILCQNGRNSRKISSPPSQSNQIPLSRLNTYQQLPAQPTNFDEGQAKEKSFKVIKHEYTSLSWQQDSQNLPQISFNITVEQISNSFLMFHCWKISHNNDQTTHKQIMLRFANFRIALQELLKEKDVLFMEVSHPQFANTISVQQQLWFNGTIVGRCKCQLQIRMQTYIKQLQGWTRTQKGTVNMLMEDLGTDGETIYLKSFEKITKLHQQLLLTKTKLTQKVEGYFKRKQIFQQGQSIVIQICEHLQNIDMESHIHYSILMMKQLTEKQCVLLQLMNTIYTLLREQDVVFVQECWKLIVLLVKRGEFQLTRIGFTSQQSEEINFCFTKQAFDHMNDCCHKAKEKAHILLKKRAKIALQFQKLLFNCLILSLNTVPYFMDQGENGTYNCEQFKGYCFMKVPVFRQHVLKCVFRDEDAEYSQFQIKQREWLKSRVQIKQKQTQLLKELQWDEYFYKALSFHPNSKEIYQELTESLAGCVWIQELQRRDTLFFHFFKIVMTKFEHIQTRLKIPKYQYFSGYNKLIATFLSQMKSIPLKRYSATLVKSSMIMLHNEQLYQPILMIIARKTNYYNTNHVVKCLSLYKLYIKYLTQGNKTLPLSFCYGTFIKLIKKILESDAVYCVAAVLMMIYQCYDKFEMEFQSYLTIYFLGNKFVPLFYHWSHVVRSIFHHFFILKIAQNRRIFYNSDLKIYTKLYGTYQKVLQQLDETKQANKQINSKKFTQIQQDKSYHLKMKHKLWKKKQLKQSQQQAMQAIQKTRQRRYLSVDLANIDLKALSQNAQDNYQQAERQNLMQLQIFDYNRKQELAQKYLMRSDSIILIQSKNAMSQDSITPVKSKTAISQDQADSIPQPGPIRPLVKQYTFHQSAKYHGAFIQDQFNLAEFNQVQRNQITVAHKEFEKINAEITRKFIETQQLPIILLGNQVTLDEHDLKPEDLQFSNF